MLRDPAIRSFCDVSETVSCEAVYQSAYGSVLGVPVAAGGAIWSGARAAAGRPGMGSPVTAHRAAATAGYVFVLSVLGLAAVLYFGYASFFVLQKLCPAVHAVYVARDRDLPRRRAARTSIVADLAARAAADGPAGGAHAARSRPRWRSSGWSGRCRSSRSSRAESVRRRRRPPRSAGAGGDAGRGADLREWHAWLDQAAARTGDAADGSVKVRADQVQRLSVPVVPPRPGSLYKDVIAKLEAEASRCVQVRDAWTIRSKPSAAPAASTGRRARRPSPCAWRASRNRGPGDGGVALRPPAATDARLDQGRAFARWRRSSDFDAQYPADRSKVREDAQFGSSLASPGTPTFF